MNNIMKTLLLTFVCLFTISVYAQVENKSENWVKARYIPIRDTQNEDVMVKTRCIILVNNDYLVPEGQTLRGFYKDNGFVFRVELNYYEVDKYFVWDVKSPHPFRSIDQMKAEILEKKAEKERKKLERQERKKNKNNSDPIYE